jgi:hypothetical protein
MRPVPIAIVVVAAAARTIPVVKSVSRPVIDYLGIALVAVGASALILATSWGGNEYAWGSGMIIALFVGGVVALGPFCRVETRASEPMLPMRLFANPVFTVCSVLSFIVGFAMLGALTYLPTYLQSRRGVPDPRRLPPREAAVISRAWASWLEERLGQDIGRPSDSDLRIAVDAIAKRLLVEDLSHGLPGGPAKVLATSTV